MFIIYNKETTRLPGGSLMPRSFKTERAAKAYLTRVSKRRFNDPGILLVGRREDYAIADELTFHQKIEKTVERVNRMTGKVFTQPINTPLCCDPSSETYWSM
jgi:hypothetical protein